MSAIAWRVGELAEQRGWGARQLAEEAGLDQKTVRNILAGRATRVDLNTIARLSQALGVGPGALWDLGSDPAGAWGRTAGAAGEAGAGELDEVLADRWPEPDPAPGARPAVALSRCYLDANFIYAHLRSKRGATLGAIEAWRATVIDEIGRDSGVISPLVLDELAYRLILAWLRDDGERDLLSAYRADPRSAMKAARRRLGATWRAVELPLTRAAADRTPRCRTSEIADGPTGPRPSRRLPRRPRSGGRLRAHRKLQRVLRPGAGSAATESLTAVVSGRCGSRSARGSRLRLRRSWPGGGRRARPPPWRGSRGGSPRRRSSGRAPAGRAGGEGSTKARRDGSSRRSRASEARVRPTMCEGPTPLPV